MENLSKIFHCKKLLRTDKKLDSVSNAVISMKNWTVCTKCHPIQQLLWKTGQFVEMKYSWNLWRFVQNFIQLNNYSK